MASKIDASTSGAGGIITTADNSGILQLQSGGVTVATISSTGVQTNVGAPAFSAYQSSAQTVPSAAYTKIQLQTEEFDTNNNFDSTTNYRFTPTVAGYYQVNGAFGVGTTATQLVAYIYKNGSVFKVGQSAAIGSASSISAIVYCNGSTDYLEFYCYVAAGQALIATSGSTYFQAAMVRSA